MKLEAINGSSGNLLSLTIKNTEQLKVEPKEEEDDEEATEEKETEDTLHIEEAENGDEVVSGKKKGVRKKRSLNWEEAERALLLEVIKPKVEFVENRSVDAKSIKSKRLAWVQITKQFNALNFRHRSLEQIQVQWRSMKNSAKREHQLKYDKSETLEGMEMIEFLEEMQKDPVNGRNQTRGGGVLKKDIAESDEEDTPLASLPAASINSSVLNNSDDTLQSSTMALPASPTSLGDSHTNDANANTVALNSLSASNSNPHATTTTTTTTTRQRKKPQNTGGNAGSSTASGAHKDTGLINSNSSSSIGSASVTATSGGSKAKKQRMQQTSESICNANSTEFAVTNATSSGSPTISTNIQNPLNLLDDKFKKQLFDLIKRQRLADMDYARREHEQRMRHAQMEQDLKLNFYRQQEELKIRQLREEHETRMRQWQAEHEARLLVFANHSSKRNTATKTNNSNDIETE